MPFSSEGTETVVFVWSMLDPAVDAPAAIPATAATGAAAADVEAASGVGAAGLAPKLNVGAAG